MGCELPAGSNAMSELSNWFQGIDLNRIREWLMFAVAAMISISVHESSHALSAYWLGDDTAKRMKRISLNPLRHLDPVGFVMMVVAHFGWARPVPINPYRMTKVKSPKLGMAITAAAGPISNLLLALLFGLLFTLCGGRITTAGELRVFLGIEKDALYYLCQFCFSCFMLNAGLAIFNLIPISPLDGSKILAIVLPEDSYAQLMRYERYGMILLIALLWLGVLSGPLEFLVTGVLRGIYAVVEPLARLVLG